jgi:3-isopropylmalate/(R)-2-methylmalate dehydratase small subunit
VEKFTRVTSVAAPLPVANIDTDVIFPARFLLLLDKHGLAAHLFHEWRNGKAGGEPFVLDTPPYDTAKILVTGANFGGGSSREQAVWALADFGIRVVIAPAFGEIFFTNCFKNGLLPIVLGGDAHHRVMTAAEAGNELTVDLEAETLSLSDGSALPFAVDPYRKRALLLGLDEIGGIMQDDSADIAAFEASQRRQYPWLSLDDERFSYLAALGARKESGK